MMEKKSPLQDSDVRIFTLSDCIALFRRKRRRISQVAFFTACIVLIYQIQEPPLYKVKALFKEGKEKESDAGLKDLLSGFSGGAKNQSQFMTLMGSHCVVKPLIAKMGLQASVFDQGWFSRAYSTVRDKLRANRNKALKDLDPFVFRNVEYEGMEALNFSIFFDAADSFTISSKKGGDFVRGKIGEEFSFSNARCTLVRVPKNLRFRHNYLVSISPWTASANGLISHLKIIRDKLNLSVYQLAFTSRDRHFAKELLEEWMNEYRVYLRKDHDEMDREQISYLRNRQEQFYDNLSASFDEYGAYLSENLKTRGCAAFEIEIEKISALMSGMSQKLLDLEMEITRCDRLKDEDKFYLAQSSNHFASNLNNIFIEIQNLKQQRDLLSVSLEHDYTPMLAQNRLEDLKEIRTRRDTLETLQTAIEEKKAISSEFLFEPDVALASWAKSLGSSEKDRSDFGEYLANYIRILTLREKILHEQFFHPELINEELEGIDLETANSLFVEYNRKLDFSDTATKRYEALREDILRQDFEFSSLGSVLNDPLSQKLIGDASATLLALKDEKHRSLKEGERWQEELDLQKKILNEHLFQLLKAEEATNGVIRGKISALQRARLDCINQKISVLRERASDYIQECRKSLLDEKELLFAKMKDLRDQASKMPEAWRQEKWLDLKVKFGARMMDTITELVESKTIGHHLFQIESKPLNLPTLPPFAMVPYLYLKTFMSAAIASFLFFFFLLLRAVFAGFPTSSEKLKAMQMPWLGELSSFCDGVSSQSLIGPDLDLMRQIGLFLKKAPVEKVISLIGGKGPDYTYALAENLARTSKNSLIIRCDFGAKFHLLDQPGLLQFLENEIPDVPVKQGNGYSFIQSGGYTPNGHEWIQSTRFRELIDRLKKEYDYVFILSRSELSSAETIGTLSLSDRAIVTVCGEPTEFLTPFTNWGYHGEDHRIIFLTSESK